MVNALAGSMSGVISTIVLAPLDVVKTRLIIQRIPHIPKYQKSKGILGTMKHMIKHEGITSLYKGLGTNLLGYVPNWAIYFTSYEHFKESFGKSALLSNHVHLNHVFSSMLSGFITSFITSPMWVVKTRMQTQVEKKYTGTFHALSEIFKTEGIRGLYRGLAPSLFGLIHVGVQFPTYEYLKRLLKDHDKRHNSTVDILIASSVSKIIASMIAYPHEVLRSRLQDHGHGKNIQTGANYEPYKGMRDAIYRIWHEEGYRGFYRGMGANLVRVVPAAVLTLGSFEFCSQMFQKFDS
ncbi:predicted protein [Naegleria gruberi]|uniref:Predicted protein n=1 Tax=Naegleria gruberi TaxID=5762 RepID=D2V0L8_NAEGR|nr:uncharacterized protein NAEGRDRAFT_30038 [Naegleria gruberi]EFC49744.1 predicted protein [Naegleria gruberi]|eukprot:XP_002682488.1 predicted protein [Naegleria gruberi strain NEG-M]